MNIVKKPYTTRRPRPAPASAPAAETSRTRWWQTTRFLAFFGSLALWASFPPLSLAPLAWLAPLPWLLLVRRESLSGRRPYLVLWLAGFAFWLAAVYWLTLPHPATALGWLALSFYLAFYTPVFVGLSRIAVHQLRVPLLAAAPIIWTGLELARAHLLSGFSMANLAHTQCHWITLIQVSDLAGAYAVTFVIMLIASAICVAIPLGSERFRLRPLLIAATVLLATLGYGYLRNADDSHLVTGPRIALIQGNVPQTFKMDPDSAPEIIGDHITQSRAAVAQGAELIVWPETMWRFPVFIVPPDAEVSADTRKSADWLHREITGAARYVGRPLLLGVDLREFDADRTRHYNSAVLIEPGASQFAGRYDKSHRVMFGEYIPFADWFPSLYELTPLTGGIQSGAVDQPPLEVADTRLSVSICFETCVPQLIRNQVALARQAGDEPDVLVNLTNDGWFWGSSELDMHLACGIFRAVECRKPLLIAANTGLSASISSSGQLLWQGPRQHEALYVENVRLDPRQSWYLTVGDWPAGLCLMVCVGVGLAGWRQRRRERENFATGN